MSLMEKLKNKNPTRQEAENNSREEKLPVKDGIAKTEQNDAGILFFLSGKIDVTNFEKVKREILNQAEHTTIIADIGQVVYLSSAGLRMFYEIKQACMSKNVTFLIVNAAPELYKIFQVTGYSATLNISVKKDEV